MGDKDEFGNLLILLQLWVLVRFHFDDFPQHIASLSDCEQLEMCQEVFSGMRPGSISPIVDEVKRKTKPVKGPRAGSRGVLARRGPKTRNPTGGSRAGSGM